MIKISINNDAFIDETDDGYYNENYNVKAELELPEGANAIDALKMFYKAMIIEGYAEQSIMQAMHDLANFEAFENSYEFREEEI